MTQFQPAAERDSTVDDISKQTQLLKEDEKYYLQVLRNEEARNYSLHEELQNLKQQLLTCHQHAYAQRKVKVDYAIYAEVEGLKQKIELQKKRMQQLTETLSKKQLNATLIKDIERLANEEKQNAKLKRIFGTQSHRSPSELPYFVGLYLEEVRMAYDAGNQLRDFLELQRREMDFHIQELKEEIEGKTVKRNLLRTQLQKLKHEQ